MKGEKNFIDFIIDTKEDEALLQGFLACEGDETKLQDFFAGKYQVSKADCAKLAVAMKDLGLDDCPIPPAY